MTLMPPTQDPDFIPSNCNDLQKIGHKKNGIYPIIATKSKSVEMVLCDFSQTTDGIFLSNLILIFTQALFFNLIIFFLIFFSVPTKKLGVVSVKDTAVNFYVQRNKTMKCCGIIDWQVTHLNWASGFDVKTGIFTTPVSGLYMFTFTALGGGQQKNRVRLQKNQNTVGNAWGDSLYDTMTISSTLYLVKGDQISANLVEGGIYDNGHRLSHFTGTLLEQSPIVINNKALTNIKHTA